MSRSQSRSALVLLGALALGTPALGQQSFNIDLGANLTFGVPSNAYGAAAGQPGTWNDVQAFAVSQPLVDLTGAATTVTLTDAGTGVQNYESDNAATSGDDEALLDDFTDLGCAVGDATAYTISGLPDDDYEIYTYAWASDGAGFRTDITVTGSPDPLQSVGGDWTGSHVLGVTYAVHRVTVSGGSDVDIQAVTSSGCGSVNGFQVVSGSGSGISVECDPALNHSQGNYTKLDDSSLGAGGGTLSGLHLEATDGPPGEFGYFLVSAGASSSLPISNGILCLDTPQGRYAPAAGVTALNSIGQFDALGTYQSLIQAQQGWDVPTGLPTPPGGSIAAGDTWYFQMWYRDGQRSNFSNAIRVTF